VRQVGQLPRIIYSPSTLDTIFIFTNFSE